MARKPMLVILLVILALFAIKCAWSHHYTRSIGTFEIGEALAAWRSFQLYLPFCYFIVAVNAYLPSR